MQTIKVVNMKCQGCVTTIEKALKQAEISVVEIDIENQKIAFNGDGEKATKILSNLGYPQANSPKAKSLLKKARSYFSCAIGKAKK